MKNKIFKNKLYQIAIELSTENKELLAYDYRGGEINLSSHGVLNAVNSELGASIQSHFNIRLSAYGVEISDEEISMEVA